MNKEYAGTILAILAALISGFAIYANKIFVVDLDPTIFTAVRAMIIGLLFFVIASYQNKFDFSKFKTVSWKYLLIIGIVGGGLAFLLFFSGLELTTSGRAAFLHKTLPLYVALLAFIFLKEKISRKQSTALLLMFLGTVMLYVATIPSGALWADPQLGDLLVIAATVFWAVEIIVARKAMIDGQTNFIVSFGRMFFGALFLFGAVLVLGKIDLLFTLQPNQIFNLFASTAILFGYVLTFYWSIRYINASKAAAILLMAPVITLILGTYFLGEPFQALQIFASIIILLGAFYVTKVKSEVQGI
jgi:drug/metabolite transporter (DMT)-like permease